MIRKENSEIFPQIGIIFEEQHYFPGNVLLRRMKDYLIRQKSNGEARRRLYVIDRFRVTVILCQNVEKLAICFRRTRLLYCLNMLGRQDPPPYLVSDQGMQDDLRESYKPRRQLS